MPIPFRMPRASTDTWMFNQRRIHHTQKRSLLPRHCYLSSKSVWLKRCEVVTCMVTGPGDSVYETYWCDPRAFLLNELKR